MDANGGRYRASPRAGRMLTLTVVWGACFVVIRWGLRDAPTLWYAALRALIAGVALVGIGVLRGHPVRVARGSVPLLTVLGLVNVTVAFAAMFAGTEGTATSIAAVLANSQPLLIVLPAWWLFGERIGPRTLAGLAIGFVGLAMVAGLGGGGEGALLSLLAAAGITGGTLLSRRLGGEALMTAIGWHFLIGGTALVALATWVEGAPRIAWTPRFVASLIFLSLVGTAAAFVVWFEETRRSPLGAVAAWTFLVPVFGIGFGALLLGERPSTWSVVGIGLTLVGLAAALEMGSLVTFGRFLRGARRVAPAEPDLSRGSERWQPDSHSELRPPRQGSEGSHDRP